MYYCINNLKKGENTAGIKAPRDVFDICTECGFKEIPFYEPLKRKSIFLTRIGAIPTGIKNWKRVEGATKEGDWVLIQHPNENIVVGNYYINRLKKKGIHFAALIHDLETLRKSLSGENNELERRNYMADNNILKMCDCIICHNSAMKQYLVKNGIDGDSVFELGIFDYLHNGEVKINRKKEDPIVIAGNLQKGKCDYLYKMLDSNITPCKLNLYGPNYVGTNDNADIKYFGTFSPDELPGKMEGSFGLVWDGTEIDRCAGNTGEYIKYNNPHKCSLYLAAGLPVIIWKEAALASFVEKNNLGITVNSLLDIATLLKEIDEDKYKLMLKNVSEVGEKIRKGHFLRSVLTQCGLYRDTLM